MFNQWRWLVALRLFGTESGHRLMSFVGVLSISGLALAVAVLITVLSVVNGFERELREHVLAVLPHGTLYPQSSYSYPSNRQAGFSDWQSMREKVLTHPEVLGAAPIVNGAGLIVIDGALHGANFRGIDASLESTVSILPDYVSAGSMQALGTSRFGVIMGAVLATKLGLKKGDSFSMVLPDVSMTIAGPVITTKRLTVLGTFDVGADLDKTHFYLNIEDARRLKRQSGVDGIVIRVEDLFNVHSVLQDIASEHQDVYGVSWMRQNGNLYEAIGTQKATLFLLLMILVMVAAFNVVSNLVMTVDQNKSAIAILKTMGATPGDLRVIFIMHGLLAGIIGVAIGLIIGILLTLSISQIYGFIAEVFQMDLMAEYFIRYLPTEILLNDVVSIVTGCLVISLLATIYPASRAAAANPVEALQYEV